MAEVIIPASKEEVSRGAINADLWVNNIANIYTCGWRWYWRCWVECRLYFPTLNTPCSAHICVSGLRRVDSVSARCCSLPVLKTSGLSALFCPEILYFPTLQQLNRVVCLLGKLQITIPGISTRGEAGKYYPTKWINDSYSSPHAHQATQKNKSSLKSEKSFRRRSGMDSWIEQTQKSTVSSSNLPL